MIEDGSYDSYDLGYHDGCHEAYKLQDELDQALTVNFLEVQALWSGATFGPGLKTLGIIDHIKKEMIEIEAEPTDIKEWIDVAILAFDGAWRTGATPEEIITAYKEKMLKNMKRQWPDWRTVPQDKAVEHVKGIHD